MAPEEAPTFGAVIREYEVKLRRLKTLVLLRTSDHDADAADLLRLLDAQLGDVEEDVRLLHSKIEEEQRSVENAKRLAQAAHAQAARVHAMELRLPARLPGDTLAAPSAQEHHPRPLPHAPPFPAAGHSHDGQGKENEGQGAGDSPKPAAMAKRKAAQKVKAIPLVTTNELLSAPAYMRTRLTVEKLNAAIEEVQALFQAKQELLCAAPRQLDEAQRRRQTAMKQFALENPKLKGLAFITEEDVKSAKYVKQDQTGRNIMGVLRHVQRLKEISSSGCRCWYITGRTLNE